eukprot:3999680-Heterocapsa_arctica.AAC.1
MALTPAPSLAARTSDGPPTPFPADALAAGDPIVAPWRSPLPGVATSNFARLVTPFPSVSS